MTDFQSPGRSALIASNGAVATSHPLAAKVAVEMLESGGNAVDAAIAGAILLGVCEPHMCGLGGDMFALVKPAGSEEIVGINASGRAPAGLDAAALRAGGAEEMPEIGVHSIVIPGAVAGFDMLARDYGLKGLDAALAPAIRYFDEGVPVAPRVAFDWARNVETLMGVARDQYLANGAAPGLGQQFRLPGQAEVLRRVAQHGAKAFYEGEIAADMGAALAAAGGAHRAEDFAAAAADYVAPISGSYRGVEVVEIPPNGQGATALLILGILEALGPAPTDPMSAERVHLEAEATKLGYAARNEAISDPATMTMPVEDFTSRETAMALAARIDRARAQPMPVKPIGRPHRDTILITVVDRDRMAVSLIYSLFNSFGAGISSERFGILFNNRASGFTLEPGHPNEAAGGKRPLHTIIPGMVREGGHVVMPFGVMGGPYQAAGHARFISNLVDYGMDPQAAIDAPRAFAEAHELRLEHWYGEEVAAALTAMGHPVVRPAAGIGGAQAIRIDRERGVLIAGSDPRKDGIALGY